MSGQQVEDASFVARRVVRWFRREARDLPWRRTHDPYAIWISEVMLQQTQVKTVIPYWERWMQSFPTVQSLAAAPEERVLKAWEGLGYYSRARNLQKSARLICAAGGNFPKQFDEVLALPGVGRYTAGAICSIAYGEARPILDGNVMRVLSRLYAMPGDPRGRENQEKLWSVSAQLVSAAGKWGRCSELNQGLMELGATICLPRDALCGDCPLAAECEAHRLRRVHEFPQTRVRPKTKARQFVAYVLRKGRKVLVRQRPHGLVNGGLWEFPNFEVPRTGERNFLPGLKLSEFAVIRHTITNNRITLRALQAVVNGEAVEWARELDGEWRAMKDLHELPFARAHGRLRALLGADMES